MKVVVLASGSKGNATYLETNNTKILIDAGLSFTQIKKRLANQGITFMGLDAIFITHEHVDHTGHLNMILKHTNAPVFMSKVSFHNIYERNRPNPAMFQIHFITENTKYQVGDFIFVPITLSHDARNTFGFLVKAGNSSLGYITDTGYLPQQYLPLLQKMQMLIIESNHDVEMLLNSTRIWPLKQRILSNYGHMSNELCSEVLTKVITDVTRYVVLAHISEECNTYELAYQASLSAIGSKEVKLFVAKQHEEIPLFDLEVA